MSDVHPSEAEGRTPLLTSPEYEFGAALMHYEEMVQKHPNGGEEFGKARRRVLDLFRLAARSPAPEPDFVDEFLIADRLRAAPSVEAREACPFTHEDVRLLRDEIGGVGFSEYDKVLALAARIASLLPPEKT